MTEGVVLNWLKPDPGEPDSVIHGRAAFIRGFGTYLKSVGKNAYILPDKFTAGGTVFVPYLFGDDELAAFFRQIGTYRYPKEPFRPLLLSTYFRMTYTCGLRPNEGRNLKRNEVDLNTGELRIMETKKHKSRNIVMSDEMNSLAKSYAAVRDAAFPESEFFFPSPSGGPYSAGWMQGKFKRFFALSKPDVPKDLLPSVRVYDLRHRFAKVDYMSEEAVKTLLAEPDTRTEIGVRDRFLMIFLYDTGARIQEVLDVKICDIKVDRTPTVTLHGKGKKTRIVPLNVHPHLWRHTRAMHLYQHGMDLTLISQWLGHKQLETTLIYAHADTEAKRKAITEAMASDPFLEAEPVNYTVSDDEILKRLYGL